jgi:hypothetical protein
VRFLRAVAPLAFVAAFVLASLTSPAIETASATTHAAHIKTPVETALAWFSAINHKNVYLAKSYFLPADAGMTAWVKGYKSKGTPFTDIHCRPAPYGPGYANVRCTFREAPSPDEGQPDSFWTVSLVRQRDGRWLISNYGQP